MRCRNGLHEIISSPCQACLRAKWARNNSKPSTRMRKIRYKLSPRGRIVSARYEAKRPPRRPYLTQRNREYRQRMRALMPFVPQFMWATMRRWREWLLRRQP